MTAQHALSSLALLALLHGCGDGTTATDAGPDTGGRLDGAVADDAGARDGGGVDVGLVVGDGGLADDAGALADDAGALADDGGLADDAGALVDAASPVDAASLLDAAPVADSGPGPADAAIDGGPTEPCVSAGGSCVAVVPGSCARGVVGNPDWYSCGGGLGVMCCLPATTAPTCQAIGSRSEGWFQPDGTLICFASCAGATLTCEAIGTRSEGWYTDSAPAACMSMLRERLVQWTRCAP